MSKQTTLTLETFFVGDLDEPDLYVAQIVDRILLSELGKWLDSIGSTVYTHTYVDFESFGHRVKITARMSEENAVYYKLKWG